MKVGLSFSRCISDIFFQRVAFDDVLCIIASTHLRSREQVSDMVKQSWGTNEPAILDGLIDVALACWDAGKVHQPRAFTAGYSNGFNLDETGNWLELISLADHKHPTVQRAWDTYRVARKLAYNKDQVDT